MKRVLSDVLEIIMYWDVATSRVKEEGSRSVLEDVIGEHLWYSLYIAAATQLRLCLRLLCRIRVSML